MYIDFDLKVFIIQVILAVSIIGAGYMMASCISDSETNAGDEQTQKDHYIFPMDHSILVFYHDGHEYLKSEKGHITHSESCKCKKGIADNAK